MANNHSQPKKLLLIPLMFSLALSVSPQVLAESPSPSTLPATADSSNIKNAASSMINSLRIHNGSIIVKLSDTPKRPPIRRDFAFTRSIDGSQKQNLSVSDYIWDKSTNTAYFSFSPVSSKTLDQKVEITAAFLEEEQSASYTVAKKGSAVEEISFDLLSLDNQLTVGSKDDETLRLIPIPTDAQGQAVAGQKEKWKSSDLKIARVSSTGVVKAVGAGIAEITVDIGGKTASYEVTVLPAPPKLKSVNAANGLISVQLDRTPAAEPAPEDFSVTAEINEKTTQKIEVTAVHWDSKKNIAQLAFDPILPSAVDQDVRFSVAYGSQQKYSRYVTVKKIKSDVDRVEIVNGGKDPVLVLGTDQDTLQVEAVARDKQGNTVQGSYVRWVSSNKKVAAVNQSGKVTAVGKGSATIAVTIDGKTSSIPIVVKEPETQPALQLDRLSFAESSQNDGSVTGVETVTLRNGKFASDLAAGDVTVEHLPAGLSVKLERLSDTKIAISFSGMATQHSARDSRDDLRIVVAKGKVLGAANEVVSQAFEIRFADPYTPPTPSAPSATFDASQDGKTISGQTYQNVAITADRLTLKDTRIKGTLTISASSDVTLDNVVVDGPIIIQ